MLLLLALSINFVFYFFSTELIFHSDKVKDIEIKKDLFGGHKIWTSLNIGKILNITKTLDDFYANAS